MACNLLFLLFSLLTSKGFSKELYHGFTYNGFHGSNLSLNGLVTITNQGLLRLTNGTRQHIGQAFYPKLLPFKNTSNNKSLSFSTTFVFAIVPNSPPNFGGHGIAFIISPSKDLTGAVPSQYLGLFNLTTNGNPSNHIVAIELDTILNPEFGDINDNHVGIDLNSLTSVASAPASYFHNGTGKFNNLTLISGSPMQLWIDYDGAQGRLDVTLAPIQVSKPNRPLLSIALNLSPIVKESMYVGFSSSTGSMMTSHYILGWSFQINGESLPLNLSSLPSLPMPSTSQRKRSKSIVLPTVLPIIVAILVLEIILGIVYVVRRFKFAEIIEDWELEYSHQRFSYKELYLATEGFAEQKIIGSGGLGRFYRGALPTSKIEVAIKKVSHGSSQGMKEFIAEIASISKIRHPNLVRLHGYCLRKGELFLVYDFIPNGSLDKLLFNQTKAKLDWTQRFHIVKGVASGLLCLHEEWVQVVFHRDIKASNVLLDNGMNGLLGDFGLARLYDQGTDPQINHMVGAFGYIAPELTRTRKATTRSDVFAFGVFLLEVACGRRPLSRLPAAEDVILVDWVLDCWKRGKILEAADQNLEGEYVMEEMELVLKLALFCAHPLGESRPSMRQVVQFLNRRVRLPTLSIDGFRSNRLTFRYD